MSQASIWLLMILVTSVFSNDSISGLSITCVENCSLAIEAISMMIGLSQADCEARTLDSGKLELRFRSLDNQTLYERILLMKSNPSENAPLSKARIISIAPIILTLAPSTLSEQPQSQVPILVSLAPKQATDESGLSTGGIVGISVALVVLVFISVFTFSKWYMWRYAMKHQYRGAEELDAGVSQEVSTTPAAATLDPQVRNTALEMSEPDDDQKAEKEISPDFEFVVD